MFRLNLPAVILIAIALAATSDAGPVHVDLSSVANRALEDDAVAGNGQGGWSDEGTNDLFIYPSIPQGKVVRNGHHFHLPAPKAPHDATAILLRGQKLPDLPKQVTVQVENASGRYVYFLHTLIHLPDDMPADASVARYTVRYADGSEQAIDMHAGRHLRHWWTGSWFDNSGADAWPIFVGRNADSGKWKQYVGVWATRWSNPHPELPITSITLESADLAVPAILAITIDDDDYHASDAIKSHFRRPDEAPVGFFDAKLAHQSRQIYDAMVERDMVRGIRSVDVMAPDLLAVTLDAWVARGPGAGASKADALQSPEAFRIAINGGDPIQPQRVGRFSFEYWNGDIGPFELQLIYWHTYYLKLEQPLPGGATFSVQVPAIEEPLIGRAQSTFVPEQLITPVIKVNQVAYAAPSSRRYAYLGWWAGDLGAVNFDSFKTFRVIDEATGHTATGTTRLRAEQDPLSGERVYELDLSHLGSGRYHIVVDGLGRSSSFDIGSKGITELYRQTNRAYYHQRAGTALTEPYTTFTTPIHHHRVTRSGRVLTDDAPESADDPSRTYRGGYHDAADYDVFTYHLRATAQTLLAYQLHPRAFDDGDLNLPESGNGIPDLLDEAHWALLAYLELQQEDGGVPLGRGNQQDAQRDWVRRHGRAPEYGIFPPRTTSSAEYAAVAAQYARLVRPFDSDRAAAYLASARRAFDWAQAHDDQGAEADRAGKLLRTWAAAELYATTGAEADHATFRRLYDDGGYRNYHYGYAVNLPAFMSAYLLMDEQRVDPSIRAALRSELIRRADDAVRKLDAPAYRVSLGARERGFGWGSLNGGGHYANLLLFVHHLTGEQRYLDAASLNADFQLGCNPLSRTFITGMGDRPPRHPQIAAYLYSQAGKTGTTVPGITIYGLADRAPSWHPTSIPPWRRWRDLGNGGAEVSSEFTITETIGASSMLYSMLHALHRDMEQTTAPETNLSTEQGRRP